MKYQDLYRIRFTGRFSVSDLFEKIRHSPTEWVMIADMSYQCLEPPTDIESADRRVLYVPQILPFSSKIQNPFGKKINHVSLQANLKTQPVLTNVDVRPDFVPFCVMGHKATLMRLAKSCSNTEDFFLQLSLLIGSSYDLKVLEGWLATVKFKESSPIARANLASTYSRHTLNYLLDTEPDEIVVKNHRGSMNGVTNSNRIGFSHLYNKVNRSDVLLTDSYSDDYQYCQYNYITFALDPEIDADFYFALPGAMVSGFDMSRTFAQIVLPDHLSPGPLFTPNLDPIGTFAVKQFSSNIHFAPPFTTCSENLLTAIEILVSCSPKSILINSNKVMSALVASGNNAESIKRQTFMTRIIEHCTDRGISLKILGDVCQLS